MYSADLKCIKSTKSAVLLTFINSVAEIFCASSTDINENLTDFGVRHTCSEIKTRGMEKISSGKCKK